MGLGKGYGDKNRRNRQEIMTERLSLFLELREQEGTKNKRTELLHEMTNEELDYLIEHTDNHTGKAYFGSFKKR